MSDFHPPPPPSRRRWWIVLGVVGIVAIAAAIGTRPVYRALKSMRAEKLAVEAEALTKEQRWEEAFRKAQSAHQLAPVNPKVLRAVARLYGAVGQDQALAFWEHLLKLPQGTAADRRELAKLAIRLRRFDVAEPQVVKLLEVEPEDAANLALAAELYFLKPDHAKALSYCQRATEKAPEDVPLQLLLARLLALSTDPADNLEAKQKFLALGQRDDALGLDALKLALNLENLFSDEAQTLVDRLNSHPQSAAEHRLIAIDLLIKLEPRRRPALVAETAEKYRAANLSERMAAARWMNRHIEFKRALDLLPLDEVMGEREAFLVRVDSMAALRQWQELRSLFEEQKVPIENVLKELYLARITRQLNEPYQADVHWRKVHLEAGKQPHTLAYIAVYAERLGERVEAIKAYRRLTQVPAFAKQAHVALVRLVEIEGDTSALRDVVKEMVAVYPDDLEPRNDLNYLNLLLNEHIDAARESSVQLVEKNPRMLAFRTTLALAHLRSNDPEAAWRAYSGVKGVNWRLVQPGWQAVHSAVLAGNRQTDLARKLAAQIPLDRLKKEERALIETLLP